ncbi:hypothetical protein PInf_001339 [Phytophthora infestans]|nr:hypothetical protein PInf_001339 [Phytophthora infestans]
MRAVNRSFYTGIPRHTWELTASNINSSKSMDQLSRVQEPAIIAPNLEILAIEHCPVTRFHADTKLPQLKKLSLSSRSLTALQARSLIKNMLPKSPALEDLSFASCSQLEQVLVDPGDLPALRRLDLSGCPKLCRVHVTSKLLEYLDLSRNDNLQYVLLDLERMVDLDLSFLKNLTHLYIRSVTCPNLQYVVLQGTTLKIDYFNRDEVIDEVFALPESTDLLPMDITNIPVQ